MHSDGDDHRDTENLEHKGLDYVNFQAVTLANLTDGSYTFNVSDGVYYPVAFAAVRSGKRDIKVFGIYDPDTDGFADSIVVSGGNVTGIDISLKQLNTIGIVGKIRDKKNRPVAGATLILNGSQIQDSTVSNFGGRYQFNDEIGRASCRERV